MMMIIKEEGIMGNGQLIREDLGKLKLKRSVQDDSYAYSVTDLTMLIIKVEDVMGNELRDVFGEFVEIDEIFLGI